MFKLRQLLVVLALCISGITIGQTKSKTTVRKKDQSAGFYGKRFTLQFGGGIHHNSFLKIASRHEKNYRNYYHNELKDPKGADQFNYSLYANAGYVLRDRIALSVDFNYYFGNMFIENYEQVEPYDDNSGTAIYPFGKTARINYHTIRIMPRIEIGSPGSNSPTGLTNIIGLGLEMSKGKSGKYNTFLNNEYYPYYYYSDLGEITGTHAPNTQITLPEKAAFNVVLMYGLEYRWSLSKNIAINLGGYVHVNLPVEAWAEDADIFGSINVNTEGWEFRRQLSLYRAQNFFSVRTGIMFML